MLWGGVAGGALELRDGDEALSFEATIAPETTWARDFLAAHDAGLIRGLSPGFRVSPDGERIEARSGVVRRTITAADLFELSAVTRPAYGGAQIEARNWNATVPKRWQASCRRWRRRKRRALIQTRR